MDLFWSFGILGWDATGRSYWDTMVKVKVGKIAYWELFDYLGIYILQHTRLSTMV